MHSYQKLTLILANITMDVVDDDYDDEYPEDSADKRKENINISAADSDY